MDDSGLNKNLMKIVEEIIRASHGHVGYGLHYKNFGLLQCSFWLQKTPKITANIFFHQVGGRCLLDPKVGIQNFFPNKTP